MQSCLILKHACVCVCVLISGQLHTSGQLYLRTTLCLRTILYFMAFTVYIHILHSPLLKCHGCGTINPHGYIYPDIHHSYIHKMGFGEYLAICVGEM